MERVTFVHNPTAGDGEHSRESLESVLREAGYEPEYFSTEEGEYRAALKSPREIVVVAGGDGTIRKVAKRLVGSDSAIAILPAGTANNVATSLGLCDEFARLVEGWRGGERRRFDVGRAAGPWGEKLFFESAGFGLFAEVMRALDVEEKRNPETFEQADDPLMLALRALREALESYEAHELNVRIDDEDASGRYLMVEAMNIRMIGPHLFLAPDADPGDGALDFVLLREDDREEFDEYLGHRLEGKQVAPFLPVRRGRRMSFEWDGSLLKFDDSAWPKEKKREELSREARRKERGGDPIEVEVTLEKGGLILLLPAEEKRREGEG